MECNKEEAIRAKEIAEARMQNNDFAGALRFAQKAQRLFPELENLSQMLAVCEIHCSAQTTVCGSEHDWYGILQIEKSADDITIKKQYRKFALLLHPDKNKFTGAEAAFKLIVEANRVLTDQLQRKLYDSKFRKSVQPQKPPARQPTRYSGVRRNGTGNKSESPPNSHFSSSNADQQGQQQTFWTSCPLCNIRYQYYRQFVNKALRCQTCKKPFIAYDFSTQGMAPGPQWNHFPNQPDVSNFGFSKATPEANNGVPPMQFADGFSGSVPLTKQKDHGEVDGSLRAKVGNESIDKGAGMEEDRTPYENAARQTEIGSQSTTGWMRCGNSGVEFGGASENVSRNDTVGDAGTSEDGINPSQSNSELNGAMRSQQKQPPSRKSPRLKQHVLYNDNSVGDNDFVSPPKRSRANRASDSAEAKEKQGTVEGFSNDCSIPKCCINNDIKNKKVIPQKESLSGKDSGKKKPEEKRGEAVSGDEHNEKSKSESSSGLDPGLEPHIVVCPDPDFSDFEKDKAQTCFAVNQVWALYDTIDGMPRFYARIKKVFSPGFKVQITWLEADPDDQDEIEWCDNELPVACGKYRTGHTEEIEDHLMFSHQIEWLKGVRRGSFLVYPRKGEIWALFKNWDIKWSSEPEKYLPCKYEYVEILSDFDKDCGIKVVYLSKVKGFVCLFQRVDACKDANASFEIAPRHLYRFAHRVPSFMMTGNERRGVPAGSFELDPAALDIDELRDTVEKKSADADVRKRVPKNPTVETLPVRRSPRALSKQR